MFSIIITILSAMALSGLGFWPWPFDFGGIYPSWVLWFTVATRIIDVVGIVVIIVLLTRKKSRRSDQSISNKEAAK